MPRTCSICASPKADAVRAPVLSGVSDVVIAREYGFSRAAMQRHRLGHIEAPARQVALLAGKDRHAVQERAALASATAADPRVWLALDAITGDLRKVHDRLDQAADESGGSAAGGGPQRPVRAVAPRHRVALEAAGGVGQDAKAAGPPFKLTINIGGDGQPVTIHGDATDDT